MPALPIPGTSVRALRNADGWHLWLRTPQALGLPEYGGGGATFREALGAAVQLFHDSAHAYPAAQPYAAPGSYAPPAHAYPFPDDDQELDPEACEHCGGSGEGLRPDPYDGDPGCAACGGSGKRRKGYWNNYGHDDYVGDYD